MPPMPMATLSKRAAPAEKHCPKCGGELIAGFLGWWQAAHPSPDTKSTNTAPSRVPTVITLVAASLLAGSVGIPWEEVYAGPESMRIFAGWIVLPEVIGIVVCALAQLGTKTKETAAKLAIANLKPCGLRLLIRGVYSFDESVGWFIEHRGPQFRYENWAWRLGCDGCSRAHSALSGPVSRNNGNWEGSIARGQYRKSFGQFSPSRRPCRTAKGHSDRLRTNGACRRERFGN